MYKIYEPTKTDKVFLEMTEQINFASWLDLNFPHLLWFHPANEGKRTGRTAYDLRRMGLKSGVSDIIILTPNKKYNFMVIELKRNTKKARVTDEQKAFLNKCVSVGGMACLCYGLTSAKQAVIEFCKDM